MPFRLNQLLVLLLFPGGNEVVDEIAAGVVAAMQHMMSSVERLLEEERLGDWHNKGFRCVVGVLLCCALWCCIFHILYISCG